MKQFVLPAHYAGDSELTVTGRDFHYLHRVRRLGEGDRFAGLLREGTPVELSVVEAGPSSMRLRVERAGGEAGAAGDAPAPAVGERGHAGGNADAADTRAVPDLLPQITLYQGLPKAGKLDLIIRQAVEAGVSRIVPVASAHAIARVDGAERSRRKLERWQRIAEEAVQQSGRHSVPSVEPVRELEEIPPVPAAEDEVGLVFHEKALADDGVGGYLDADRRRVLLVIGPEGGLSEEEVSALDRRGFSRVSLGPQVLRTETAALYAIAAVQSVYRELVRWKQ